MATLSESSSDMESLDSPIGGVALDRGAGLPPRDADALDLSEPTTPPDLTPPTPSKDEQLTTNFLNARAYQHEMFAESMQRNIILAMDTGSGKTQVAVLRIRAELDKTGPEKIVWFLAPTVQLCNQQDHVLRTQIPAVQIKLLRGEDNIESWSSKTTWDTALRNVRVVVSTPQILLDAMVHAFVSMDRLALIVFDEAHNSVKNNSCSKLMRDFYHPRKIAGQYVPHIMGLTASPIMNSNLEGLETLEQTLDAVCRSPSIHRSELLAHVKRPILSQAFYDGRSLFQGTPSLASLVNGFRSLDIREDPHILHLKSLGTDRSRRELEKAFIKRDTYIHNQLVSFCQRSKQLLAILGPWAVDLYIWRVIAGFQQLVKSQDLTISNWKDEEKKYLLRILNNVDAEEPSPGALNDQTITDKVSVLMDQLLASQENTVGIVFVRERTTASILSEVICSHPRMRQRFPKVGVMAGTSQYAARKRDVWDLFKGVNSSLEDFRAGNVKLLVSTSVLEEGIDVPSCNLVICFDEPANLKSFIQIRGRARERDSRLIVILDKTTPGNNEWESLEAQMKLQYENQDRELKKLEDIEASEESSSEKYIVESTGAMLDHDNAKGHLDHFCSKLSPGEYVDSRPDYITKALDDSKIPYLTTTVFLPSYIPATVRRAVSKQLWRSEKNSTKDAAFQAYVALHKAGLVNDHLLPLQLKDLVPQVAKRRGLLPVNGLLNVWIGIARAWEDGWGKAWSSTVTLKDPQGLVQGTYEMVLPLPVPSIPSTPIHFSHDDIWSLDFGPFKVRSRRLTDDHTAVLLALSFQHRWPCHEKQHVISFISKSGKLTMEELGYKPLSVRYPNSQCLIRDERNCPYILETILPSKPAKELVQEIWHARPGILEFDEAPEDVPWVVMRPWPRKLEFLRPVTIETASACRNAKLYPRVHPVEWMKADAIQLSHARFGLLIPSILHHVEVRLIAAELSSSLLRDVAISNLSLVLTAISASAAGEPTNYERLEMLGDTILKLCTTISLTALHLNWPEYYLSIKKESLVSNARLCRAALDRGLDKFILTWGFHGQKWTPIYVEDVLEHMQADSGSRIMSSKTLADVVEALIGASYCDGGLTKALSCISVFLSEVEWHPIDVSRQILYDEAPSGIELPSTLLPLEQLLGYTFRKKGLLVEATTHASLGMGSSSGCLERLEFMGDAVLDYIIVRRLFSRNEIPYHIVHLLKTATVNGDLLGFMCLEHHIDQEQFDIVPATEGPQSQSSGSDSGGQKATKTAPTIERSTFALPLWKFMRHSSPGIHKEQKAMTERHAAQRGAILEALWKGKAFPWTLLARLQVRKFYSDLLEAIIGAVWVDSGDMDICAEVLTKFGIIPLLERLIRDKVHIQHPKEELGHFVDNSQVKYVYYTGDIDMGDGIRAPWHGSGLTEGSGNRCKIMVGDRCLVDIEAGATKLVTETTAAEMALRILKEERSAQKEQA